MRQVERMIVLWAVTMKPPEIDGSSDYESRCLEKLIIQQIDGHRLTSRFKTQPSNISTDAVFSVDDDLMIAEEDIDHAFDVWKAHPWGVVGFNERKCIRSKTGFMCSDHHDGTYHFILTNSAFIHRNYLDLFDRRIEPSLLDEIDRRMNCENLAINILASDYCRCTVAFKVKYRHAIKFPSSASTSFTGSGGSELNGDLSSRPRYYIERGECLSIMEPYYRVRLAPNSCTY
jgi:hypothetical protein